MKKLEVVCVVDPSFQEGFVASLGALGMPNCDTGQPGKGLTILLRAQECSHALPDSTVRSALQANICANTVGVLFIMARFAEALVYLRKAGVCNIRLFGITS